MQVLAIDIGGSTTKLAIINDQGQLLRKYPVIQTQKGHDLKWLFSHIDDIDLAYECICIDIPGFYNKKESILSLAGNLDYRNFDVLHEVYKYTQKQTFVLNDANAAALGEYWKLGSDKYSNALFYILGTGIGGALILDGKLYEGSQGYAGEFGHGHMFDENSCSCGLKGCLEPFSSAKGITNKINEYAKDPANTKLHALYLLKQSTSDPRIHLNELTEIISSRDEPTINAMKEALGPLVKHMSLMTYALNPDIIIIGGGPSNHGEVFLETISTLYTQAVADWLIPTVNLVLARQLNDAALYGCAYYAISNYQK